MSGFGHGVLVLDALGVATALLAAWWWYLAGTRRLRRVSRFEALDAADFNRIVTAMNRSSVLSLPRRARRRRLRRLRRPCASRSTLARLVAPHPKPSGRGEPTPPGASRPSVPA
jgi:hypothetical protein